ncbi:MAG TPA: 4Fe-4S binding protein [Acidobacteriota bacterium]|nr:4Fe-4S binding protein [Acidobacteriota bacterium]
MAMIELREARCKGCGLCVMACPKQLLKVGTRLNGAGYPVAIIEDMEACTGCAFCAEMCPDLVITVFK